MEILDFKKLQNLFSWAQFYQNSEQLTVARYPRQYTWENNKKMMVQYEPDLAKYNYVQEQIKELGNSDSGQKRGYGLVLNGVFHEYKNLNLNKY